MTISNDKDLIEEIKKKKKKNSLESEKYQPEKDISLSIFIENMESRFKELSVLKAP